MVNSIKMTYFKKMKAKLDITYLEKENISIKCHYSSPLDFFRFGYLKQEISKRQPRTYGSSNFLIDHGTAHTSLIEGIWKIFWGYGQASTLI